MAVLVNYGLNVEEVIYKMMLHQSKAHTIFVTSGKVDVDFRKAQVFGKHAAKSLHYFGTGK